MMTAMAKGTMMRGPEARVSRRPSRSKRPKAAEPPQALIEALADALRDILRDERRARAA
jgi:hypothetical protein